MSEQWYLPRLTEPRRIVLHGCDVLVHGSLGITVPDGTDPRRWADMLQAEPRAIHLVPPTEAK